MPIYQVEADVLFTLQTSKTYCNNLKRQAPV